MVIAAKNSKTILVNDDEFINGYIKFSEEFCAENRLYATSKLANYYLTLNHNVWQTLIIVKSTKNT